MIRPHSTRGTSGAPAVVLGGMVAIVAVLLTACGISTDPAPRDIASPAIEAGSEEEIDARTATDERQVYFVQIDGAGAVSRVVAEERSLATGRDRDPTLLLEALIGGPTEAERNEGTVSLLPPDLQVLGWSPRPGGVITIDLSAELNQLTGPTLVAALAQIVYTVSPSSGDDGVRITVEGRSQSWPDGNGQLRDGALTVYDYPGLISSSQPAFPAIPSGRPDGA